MERQIPQLEPMWNVSNQVNANVGMDVLPIAPSSPPHHVMNLKFPWYVFRYETLVPPSKPQSISFYHPLPLSSFEKSNSSYALRTFGFLFGRVKNWMGMGILQDPLRILMVRQLMACSIFSSKYSPSPSVPTMAGIKSQNGFVINLEGQESF